ncbi:MAG: hypothetical protein DMG29_02365 [Acidobacteria bacterium]|nr:MAG: hypothetical protein DMG29_02365 [Acidobacteriota bacterium]
MGLVIDQWEMGMPSKVLVVDDDPVLCELLREVLSTELEAHAMTDSAQASARIREEKFDAVFLDVRMPHPDGIELARHVRSSKLNQTTPIVMITGDEDRNAMMRAFQAGATFFLSKPVDRPRLMRLIRATEGFMQQEKRRFQRVKVSCLNGMLVQAHRAFPVGSSFKPASNLRRTRHRFAWLLASFA